MHTWLYAHIHRSWGTDSWLDVIHTRECGLHFIRTYVLHCIRTCMYTFNHAHTYISCRYVCDVCAVCSMCVVCVQCALMCVCMYASMYAWHADLHTYMHTYMQTYQQTYIQTCMHTCLHTCIYRCIHTYGVAATSRLLKIIRLFCKRDLQKRRYSAKETYNFKELCINVCMYGCISVCITYRLAHIHANKHSNMYTYIQPIAFAVSLNLNLQSHFPWSLFNGTW